MANMHEVMESMYNKLDKFLKTETVIGEPMEIGNIKLIPIISASFGIGGGGSEGGDTKAKDGGKGTGGGLGCRITPNAILVVKGDEVNLISLSKQGCLDKLFEQLPELLKMVKGPQEEKEATVNSDSEEKQESNSTN